MSNRIVTYARFQTNMFLPGFGQVGDCLPSQSRKLEMTSLKMTESTYGLEVRLKGRTVVIPWPNVVGYETQEPEPTPPKTVITPKAA